MNNLTTVRDYISHIKTAINNNNSDVSLSRRYIYNVLNNCRLTLLNQEVKLSGYKRIGEIYRPVKIFELEEVPITELEGECFGVCETVLRTVLPLPSRLSSRKNILITVLNRTFERTFTYIDVTDYKRVKVRNKRLNKPLFVYWFDGDHLVIPDNTLSQIAIKAIWLEGEFIEGCKSILDQEFVLPTFLRDSLITMTINQIMQSNLKVPMDPQVNNEPYR